jgi:hypothetical protein
MASGGSPVASCSSWITSSETRCKPAMRSPRPSASAGISMGSARASSSGESRLAVRSPIASCMAEATVSPAGAPPAPVWRAPVWRALVWRALASQALISPTPGSPWTRPFPEGWPSSGARSGVCRTPACLPDLRDRQPRNCQPEWFFMSSSGSAPTGQTDRSIGPCTWQHEPRPWGVHRWPKLRDPSKRKREQRGGEGQQDRGHQEHVAGFVGMAGDATSGMG